MALLIISAHTQIIDFCYNPAGRRYTHWCFDSPISVKIRGLIYHAASLRHSENKYFLKINFSLLFVSMEVCAEQTNSYRN